MAAKSAPHHNYLTEPRWFTARAVVRELTCLETWAQVFSVGAVLVVIMIIAS